MSVTFLDECFDVLTRTPRTLDAMLRGMSPQLTSATEGPGTWSPYDVLGHLVHGERTDWMVRLQIILEHGTSRAFDVFDREAQFTDSAGKSLENLLDEFAVCRKANVEALRALNLQPSHLDLVGTHPGLGRVTARQLLATWTAHDLAHILQISRTMAKRYKTEVGPWAEYLSVMK